MKNTPKQALPLVRFMYPNRQNKDILKDRYVYVTKRDNEYVEGYEVQIKSVAPSTEYQHSGILNIEVDTIENGKFKRFCINKISLIIFMWFVQ